jgi:hypothetical protein
MQALKARTAAAKTNRGVFIVRRFEGFSTGKQA